jgi:hypothetical protein
MGRRSLPHLPRAFFYSKVGPTGHLTRLFTCHGRQEFILRGVKTMAIAAKKAARKKSKKTIVQRVTTKGPVARKQRESAYRAKTAVEITATFTDTIGLTAKVAAAVAAEKVNILAATGTSASSLRRNATFTLIVDDFAKAERALEKIGAEEIQESSIIMVETPNKVGALERIAKLIADAGINIYYFYATTSSGKTATSVIKTADDKKAIRVLREA